MRRRGFTLVELMICVAIMGILGLLFDVLATNAERTALGEVQRARAGLLLDYHARQLASGAPIAPLLDEELRASLPNAQVEHQRVGKTVTVRVSWVAAGAQRGELALTVLTGGGR